MSDALSGPSADTTARADQARRAADEAARAQQAQQAQQQAQQAQQLSGAQQAAATTAVVAGAAHDNETRGQPGAGLIGAARPAGAPPLPAASADPASLYGPSAPSTDNPARPAGQAPTSRDVDTALRQTAHAPEAARALARQAGVDPARVAVTGNEWRTIERRTTEIELQRGEHAQGRGPEPRTWDGRAIPADADAAAVARDDVMSQRFGGRENWERVQRHAADAPQAQLDAAVPANDPRKNDRARLATIAFGGAAVSRALRPSTPSTTTPPATTATTAPARPTQAARPGEVQPSTTTRPAEAARPAGSLTPDRVRPADAARIAEQTGVPAERVNRIANDLHAEVRSTGGTPIAGAPGQPVVRDAPRLAAQHGGQPQDWVKVSTSAREYQSNGQVRSAQGQATRQPNGNGPTTVDNLPAGDVVPKFEVHAYRNTQTGQIVEPKLVSYGRGRTNLDATITE